MGLFLNSFFSDPIAITFILVILFFFLTGIFTCIKIKDTDDSRFVKFVSFTPTLLTTLGVIGTFVGILLGLLEFNSKDIDSSIQQLLDGVKISFTTSIAGMFTSVVFRLITIIIDKSTSFNVVTPADIHYAINQLKESIQPEEKSKDSLIGQIQVLQDNMHEDIKELIKEFQDYKEDMIESTQNAIIVEFRGVIKDYNEEIIKHLIDALETIKQQTHILSEQFTGLSTIQKLPPKSLPEIEDDFNKLASGFAKKIQEILQSLELSTEIWEQSQRDIMKRHKKLQKDQNKFLFMFEKAQRQILLSVQESIELNKIESEGNAVLVQNNLEHLNSAMEKALTSAIKELGKQLASLNQKIIEDHGEFINLIEYLQEILDHAKYKTKRSEDD